MRTTGIALVLALVLAAGAEAAKPRPVYRTDAQAQTYLQTLKVWHGVKLHAPSAFCLNGYYSKTEKRTGHHLPQGHENARGEDTFGSFACTITSGSRSFHVYVVAKPHGWTVAVDR